MSQRQVNQQMEKNLIARLLTISHSAMEVGCLHLEKMEDPDFNRMESMLEKQFKLFLEEEVVLQEDTRYRKSYMGAVFGMTLQTSPTKKHPT